VQHNDGVDKWATTTKGKAMMPRATFEETLQAHLRRQPFKPFVIEFDDGRRWIVDKREALSYYTGDSALYFRPDGSLDFVDSDAVCRFAELAAATPA
jgi:hypothetical protein